MSSSISDYDSFRQAVYEAATDDSKFKNFLRHPEILKIFGHYKYENALKICGSDIGSHIIDYLDKIAIKNGYTYTLLPEYDKYDSFLSNNNKIKIPSGTLLYTQSFVMEFIRVAIDIKNKLNIENLWYYQIVELGIGFLGQFLTLEGQYREYYMIDLPEVLLLADKIIQKKIQHADMWHEDELAYLNKWVNDVNKISTFDLNRYPFHTKELDTNGIFFSSHAFSELTREHQLNVYENVIRHCKSGYILMNQISHLHGVDSMSRGEHKRILMQQGKKNIEIHEEWPLTFKGNYVLTWGKNERT